MAKKKKVNMHIWIKSGLPPSKAVTFELDVSRSYSVFISLSIPVFVGQWDGDLSAAKSERQTERGDEDVHGAHEHGPQAGKEGVTQL